MPTFKDMIRAGEVKRADALKVRLHDIHPEPGFNVRQQNDALEAHIEGLKTFILGGGSPPPIEVRPRDEGGVWIVDGYCRTEGYKRAVAEGAPIEWIEVRAFQGNDADRTARIATSAEGLKLDPVETAVIYKRLRGMGLDTQAIAKLVNKTPQHVGQVLTLGDSDVGLQNLVSTGKVSANVAVRAVKKHGGNAVQVVQAAVAKKKPGKKVTTRDTEKKVSLKPEEIRALDAFLSEKHADWLKVAEKFMDDDARRNLESRLYEAL